MVCLCSFLIASVSKVFISFVVLLSVAIKSRVSAAVLIDRLSKSGAVQHLGAFLLSKRFCTMAFQISAWIHKMAAVVLLAVVVSQAGMALGQEAPSPAPAPVTGGSLGTAMPSIAAGLAASLFALVFNYLM